MNDEYLWSKKGGDKEVERLEDLLSEFRFVPGPAPEIQITESAPLKARPRSSRWVFAFATPAFAIFILAVWVLLPRNEDDLDNRNRSASEPARNYQPSTTHRVEQITSPANERKDLKLKKPMPMLVKTVFRSHRSKRERIESLVARNQLSAEEKYAYDRLMLALSIAGNKLKVVQDTIDRKSDVEKTSLRNEK